MSSGNRLDADSDGENVTRRSNDDHDLVERFIDTVEYLNHQVNGDRVDQWRRLDVNSAQVKTMVLLENIGPMRMGMISRRLGSTLSAATGVVDRLVESEMVVRAADPSDRRVVICELTTSGRNAVEQLWRIGRERILPVVELLSREQLATAVQALEAIREASEEVQRRSDPAESAG